MHLERTVCSNLLFQRRDLSLEDLFSWSYINRKGYNDDIASLILIWQGQPHYHSMALEMTYTTWDSEHHIYVYDTLGRVVCSESQNFSFAFAWYDYDLDKRATLPKWYQLLVLSAVIDVPETQYFVCWPCGGPKQAGKSLALFVRYFCC